jgi:hypothetical protein
MMIQVRAAYGDLILGAGAGGVGVHSGDADSRVKFVNALILRRRRRLCVLIYGN